uniref:Uncharacterized protein n=1 Tax=Steinernema glaseri TaxID=37863 RepID=A0A1I8A0K5_9BILA
MTSSLIDRLQEARSSHDVSASLIVTCSPSNAAQGLFFSSTSKMNSRAGQLVVSRVASVPKVSLRGFVPHYKVVSQDERLHLATERANMLYKERTQRFLRQQISYFFAQLMKKFKFF